MKTKTIAYFISILFLGMFSCTKSDDDQKLPTPVKLLAPAENSTIELDIFEAEGNVVFEWSALPTANEQTTYTVLFDREGTLFEMPAASVLSDDDGHATKLTLTHEALDAIAEKAGIAAKKEGKLRWAVDASTGSSPITSMAGKLTIKRPSGLGITPQQLFLTGTATEGGDAIQHAIPFRKVKDGVFELISGFKEGTFKIVSAQTDDAATYYFADGELFRGDQAMEFSADAAPTLIRVDFNNTVGVQKIILSAEMIVTATHAKIASLSYAGNHVFENNNAIFNFLKPGGSDAPDWLSWEEERYKFRLQTDQGDEFYGSPYNADMNASSDPQLPVFNARPDGSVPDGYYGLYSVDPNDFWAGCYKMATKYDGKPMSVRLDFNPDKYEHSFTLN